MSYPPPRLRLSIPDLASTPTFRFRRPVVGCGESTRSPLPSPRICFGSAPASWLATADPCAASTHKHSRASHRLTHRRLRCSPGSRSHSSSPRTSACVKSAVARTPVVGLVSSASIPTPVLFLGHLWHGMLATGSMRCDAHGICPFGRINQFALLPFRHPCHVTR